MHKKPGYLAGLYGALGRIRTSDRPVRSRVLYPAELRVREGGYYIYLAWGSQGKAARMWLQVGEHIQ